MTKSTLITTLLACVIPSVASADIVVGGTMSKNLNSAALRDPGSADAAYLAGFGIAVDPNAPLLIFGNHFGPTQTAGRSVTQFRPMPVDPGLTPTGTPALPRVNYRDDAAAIEANIAAFGSTSALAFGVNGTSITPSGLPGRSEQASTFSFDPANIAGTASGAIGLDGATSLWYANVPVINTGSVWLGYGDLSLAFDAARAVGGNSGWFFTNNLLFSAVVYDVRNPVFSSVVAATGSSVGAFTFTGDLFTAQEFRDGFGIRANLNVGSFTLNAVTAIPAPGAAALLGIGGLMAGRRRRS